MGKLSESFKSLKEKWNGFGKNKKIAFGVFFIGIIAALVFLGVSVGSTKYEVLFSNMDPTDSAAVYKQLQADKVDAKVSGNSILVPKEQVDQLRMKMLSEVSMTNGSQGFELLDKSKLGSTDQEMKINYQRALQGELERTIKSFPEVENARVHLVLPEDTAFVKDTEPGNASVTLKLKAGTKLSSDQVKSVIALITGSVKNIPKENVQVIDDKMTLLSKDVYNDNKDLADSTTPAEKQQQLKENYEEDMEKRLLSMLEAIYGKDKVKVKLNADLDFDAVQQDSVTYDPKSVVVSEHGVKDTSTGQGNTSSSPVDNNMTNSAATNANGETTTHEETTKNYNVSKVEQKTIKAPGAVKRLTASIALDGNVDDATKASIRNLAVSAIGYDDKRGDTISVEGVPFDTTIKDNAKKDLDAMEKAAEQAAKTKMYTMIGIGAAALLGLAIALFLWRRKKNVEEDQLLGAQLESQGIDVIIGDDTEGQDGKQRPKFKPIELDEENERTHFENEIKKYAKDKPEQVADIVKSWLAEDER
ncbi:flagellar basal-body MS-ring/collar protein FliF [Clostridium magnum]|uniref:Flagellar M-ring protein n=1 Tax=Clostridium magnum DSM 2767 TaxID=1121326 RepID=A0A161XHJ4_9CLOT|nr:flagellar basal-body MS-ring/collar protein FliF [Clostridium magnum]KZL94136.1 flagellar M-ring protein [Clostridium magnum DSM 2767]SHH94384.1 flagellar M-ring protein FliF [Clostridium magnum DSM 2767]